MLDRFRHPSPVVALRQRRQHARVGHDRDRADERRRSGSSPAACPRAVLPPDRGVQHRQQRGRHLEVGHARACTSPRRIRRGRPRRRRRARRSRCRARSRRRAARRSDGSTARGSWTLARGEEQRRSGPRLAAQPAGLQQRVHRRHRRSSRRARPPSVLAHQRFEPPERARLRRRPDSGRARGVTTTGAGGRSYHVASPAPSR